MLKKLFKLSFSGGGSFVIALMISNGLNFIFNAYLGRVLTVEDFGLVTFINTLVLLMGIFINAFGSTVNHRVAFLVSQINRSAGLSFLNSNRQKVFNLSLVLVTLWLLCIPFSAKFFKIGDISSLLLFSPVFILFLNGMILRGYLSGNLYFFKVSIGIILEALSKLGFAVILKVLGFESFIYLSIPLSLLMSLVYFYFVTRQTVLTVRPIEGNFAFPRRFFIAAAIMGFSTTGFLTLDLLLVKHYLNPALAGEYSLLSLAGKMIYFAGSLFSSLILTYVSRDLGAGKNPNPTFYKFLLITTLVTLMGYLTIGQLGAYLMPLAFGSKVAPILPYLPTYGLAIGMYTIANAFVIYHLARHHYTFSILVLISSISMVAGIYQFHQSIGQIVNVILWVSLFNLFGMVVFHLIKRNGKFILRNLIDLLDIFSTVPNQQTYSATSQRILIFNWRDTKHKYAGGAEVYIHELSKRWVKMGYTVTQFCGNDGTAPRNEKVDGIQIIRRGGFYFVYFWAFWYYLFKFRGKYDLIIDTQNGIPFFTPLYAQEKVYCLMFHVHQEVFRKSLAKPLADFAAVLENRLMPWAYKKTRFITISESSKQEIEQMDLGQAGIEVVHPGVDLNIYKPKNQKSPHPLIIYVGRLQLYKSVDVLLNSLNKILKNSPEVKVIIAGDGEEKVKLEQLALELGLSKKVKFLGKVTEDIKIKLYQKSWVAVNPSFKEGWGITTIEANACGTPVVASNVPGLRDSVQNPHTGFLVEYGNSAAFAKKIEQLIKDKSLRHKMTKQSVKWAQNFGWDKSASKSLEIIR